MTKSNNIYFKLLLTLIAVVGCSIPSWALINTANIQGSPAPVGNSFHPDTHWYTIVYRGQNNAGAYLNSNNLNGNGELRWVVNAADANSAYSLWCFVGDATNGYLMYNRGSGTSVVLTSNNRNSNSRAKMVSVATAASNLCHYTWGSMTASGKTAYQYIRLGVTGQQGINNNSNEIAMFTHGSNLTAGGNFALELTEVEVPAAVPFTVILTGAARADEVITYENHKSFTNPQASLLVDGASNTARNGESFMFQPGITQGQLLDCDFSSSSPTRTNGTSFVYGPVIDWTNHTITCEIREAITALPTTGWYQLKYDVSTNNVDPAQRYNQSREDGNVTPIRNANRFYLTLPRGGNGNRAELLNYSPHPTVEDAPLTFVKLVRNGNNLQMMAIDGRYIQENGNPSTTGSGYNSAAVYVAPGEVYFPNWFPFAGLNNIMGKASNTRNYYYATRADFDEAKYDFYEVYFYYEGSPDVPAQGSATYSGSVQNYSMPTVYTGGYFVFPRGAAITEANFQANSVTPLSITLDATNHRLNIELPLPVITHRQSYLFDKLQNVSGNQLPGQGFIKKGEGMTTNPHTGTSIQYTSNYHITQYIKHGVSKSLFMPTIDGNSSEVTAYQRWYDYQHETLPRADVINVKSYTAQAAMYQNGIVVGSNNGRGNILKGASVNLPNDLDEYYLAVDQSRYNDGSNESNGDLREPSITMRVIYHLVDAKVLATQMNDCTDGSKSWLETHDIHYPNKKLWNGSNDTKSGVDYVGLNMEFSNYWCFNDSGTGDDDLMQLSANSLTVELDTTSTAKLTNVRVLADGMAGIGNVQGFARNRFIAFQYPLVNGKYEVPENSVAYINVYMTNDDSTRFQLARIKLTFLANAEPLLLNEVYGTNDDGSFKNARSVEAMTKAYGAPVAQLTFDHDSYIPFNCPNGTNNEAYQFPLDFKQSSYAYHGQPWASRGEYIFRAGGSGIGGKTFYPVDGMFEGAPHKVDGKYFLYIDASEQPGQVMSIPIPEKLCVGSRMFCYGWLNSATQIGQQSVGIVINIVGKHHADDEEGVVIFSYNPGLLSTRAFDSNNQLVEYINGAAPWRQVGFSFTINGDMAGEFEAYEMQVMNNCYSTNGGDYTLDNFHIFVNPPKGSIDFTTPLCVDALRHVKVHTDFDMLLETSGVNPDVPGATIPVSFCFLNKKIYDTATDQFYQVDSVTGKRTLIEGPDYTSDEIKAIFNQAFGDALIGVRSIDKSVRGHAFHNFSMPVKFDSIPAYHYNESPDDAIFKEVKGTERRIVFKEQLYQPQGEGTPWTPGESYYLVFVPYHVSDKHVQDHDVGTEMFHICDQCCVLTTFDIMPPIEVKGDATITATDQVMACDNQIVTFKVDMPALKLNEEGTDVSDAVISGLNYDWWVGTSKADATHAGFLQAEYGVYSSVEDARRYNHKSAEDYPNDADVDMTVYLEGALTNMRFFYPEARSLDEVELQEYDTHTGYGIVAEHLACIEHYMTPLEDGRKPLSLFGQTFNLKVSHDETDANHKQHFVAIPIVPEQEYSVDESLIYCPAPQELIIEVGPTAPNMQNGFASMSYPERIVNVPIRVGKMQVDGVRKDSATLTVGNTLNIPLRNIVITGKESTQLIAKETDLDRFGKIYLTATDDPSYDFDTNGGEFVMKRVAQVTEIVARKTGSAYLKIAFTNDFTIREGCTYTLKLPYVEDEACDCDGTLVFDIKVVPEYQTWTAAAGDSEWTNDKNWKRADVAELNAGNALAADAPRANGSRLDGYLSNEDNKTSNSFVPMYFTNVLLHDATVVAPSLYSVVAPSLADDRFLGGLAQPSDIIYDLEVTPVNAAMRENFTYNGNFDCELFGTNICRGITFKPATMMGNTHLLDYKKAWVEYELNAGRWYTLGTSLKKTVAGDWYSPTAGAKQVTPHFYDIVYNEQLNDRFRPAYYQRSWDRDGNNIIYLKTSGTQESFVKADWSFVYNDAAVNYNKGGFSVKPDLDYMVADTKPADGKVLVRLPKADTSYKYYDINGATGAAADAAIGARVNRLMTDDLGADGTGTISMEVVNQTNDNKYFLVSNPFMAPLDMTKFFAGNTDLEPKYWIVDGDHQMVSVKSLENNEWITTTGAGGYVAPLQGFFVKMNEDVNSKSLNVTYTLAMQSPVELHTGDGEDVKPVVLKAPARGSVAESSRIAITARRDGFESTAVVVVNENAHDAVVATEDCEAFVDGNIYDQPTVYTSAQGKAMTINVLSALNVVPLGIVSSDDASVDLTFDTDNAHFSELYIYDAQNDEFTPINSGMMMTVSGNNSGRYFLTTTMELNHNDKPAPVIKGVWTINGAYCGESTEGLLPGVYIVDGVKVVIH